jgi:SLT domain-containing protein
VTEKERREAERLAEPTFWEEMNRLGKDLSSDSGFEFGKRIFVRGYAAACEAKRAEMMDAQGEWEYLDRKLIAERARSAKLIKRLERMARWETDHQLRHLAKQAIAEDEVSRD